MVRYFYAWIPLAGIWTLLLLSLPWLGLIALLVVLFAAVSAVGGLALALLAGVRDVAHRRSGTWSDAALPLEAGAVGERVVR